MAVGLVLVAVDFRTQALDLLPDPAGWALVAVGAHLAVMRPAVVSAAAATVASVADAYLPYRHVLIDAATGDELVTCSGDQVCAEVLRFDPVDGFRLAALVAAVALGGFAVVTIARTTEARAGHRLRLQGLRDQLRAIGFAVPVVWMLPFLVLAAASLGDQAGFDPVWNGDREILGLAGVLVLLWAAAVLWVYADRGPETPDEVAGSGGIAPRT